jgi:hypothetical protein
VLTLICGLCCVGFLYLIGVVGVRRQTSSVVWAQLTKLHLKMEKESIFRNFVFQIKDKTMDNVQNCDSDISAEDNTAWQSKIMIITKKY